MTMDEIINEVWTFGKMPLVDEEKYIENLKNKLKSATKIKDIRANASIYKIDSEYILVKDNIPIGNIKISSQKIGKNKYNHVDSMYIISTYRKTTASGWFLYSVKQLVDPPLIADGAVFSDAYELIKKNKIFNAYELNKKTGEVLPLKGKINNDDKCYIFYPNDLDFKHEITESVEVWLPIFKDF